MHEWNAYEAMLDSEQQDEIRRITETRGYHVIYDAPREQCARLGHGEWYRNSQKLYGTGEIRKIGPEKCGFCDARRPIVDPDRTQNRTSRY